MRYFIQLAYDGTDYHGWQFQPNLPSVQETIEQKLSTILNTQTPIVGCGRTDAGVHAKVYYAHFEAETELPEQLAFKLNGMLPDNIAIQRILPVSDELHARYSATSRSYEYYLHFKKDPFGRRFSYYYPYHKVDWDLVRKASHKLLIFNDFSPLSKANPDLKHYNCTLTQAEWEVTDDHAVFRISANRFLHNMVRRIVGTLLTIGRGKISLNELDDVMSTQGEFKLIVLAPPQGLFLTNIEYPTLTANGQPAS